MRHNATITSVNATVTTTTCPLRFVDGGIASRGSNGDAIVDPILFVSIVPFLQRSCTSELWGVRVTAVQIVSRDSDLAPVSYTNELSAGGNRDSINSRARHRGRAEGLPRDVVCAGASGM